MGEKIITRIVKNRPAEFLGLEKRQGAPASTRALHHPGTTKKPLSIERGQQSRSR
jgi:hypothetical protein